MTAKIITELNSLLADHQVFYQKLRNYHWNVKGPHFYVLHEKFEELYEGVNEIVDALAERIVALGGAPLSTLKDQLAAARLAEDATSPAAMKMVDNVIADIDTLVAGITAARETAEGDPATEAMLDGFVESYADPRWMLQAFRTE